MNRTDIRRWAGTLMALGLFLMVVTAVAMAEEPTATPEPELTPEATLTPTATPTWTPTPTPTPAPAPAALITICHFTGGDPLYTSVVISGDDQFSPHYDHEEDIIPAPHYGCESITGNDIDDAANEKVTVCHATGDPEHPYDFFELPNGELRGHGFHPGDLIPAPNRQCPTVAVPTATPMPIPTATPEYSVPTPEPSATPEATATAKPPRSTPTPTATDEPELEGALPEDEGGDGDDGKTIPEILEERTNGAAAQSATSSALPFTGADVWVLFALGLSLTMMGAGLRLMADAGRT